MEEIAAPVQETTETSAAPTRKPNRLRWLVLPLVTVALLAMLLITRPWEPAAPRFNARNAPTPVSAAIEEKWGIRITQIGVTGDGGLVDFRFIVLDPDKALAMMQDVNNLPVLVAEDKNAWINSAALMSAKHNLKPGVTYFLLYRNTGGAIKRDTPVTVYFSENLKLEHVIAK